MNFFEIDKSNYRNLYKHKIIGVDEVGVGDYFAPLVACAVYIPPVSIQVLNQIGIKDSKKLSDKKIRELAKTIKEHVWFSLNHLSAKGYNNLTANDKYNANELKFFLHTKCINDLENRINFELVIVIDQYTTLNSIKRYHQKIFNDNWAQLKEYKNDQYFINKAENYFLAVACASILARDFLLDYMDKISQKYNFNFPLGASAQVKEKVKEFASIHGEKQLYEVCKKSFKI
ncbi:ribonuclease HIII [Mycoplasmopsis ciconiae]|uniref:Ribonuclease n=1 Tax=Mycoplasmopsis ciconiae TaxID=561067 RepID=A0ABU7MLJ6_9BACT|nr:ribonuclease HIII [Mycoplasmopsis ciconiae]